MRVRLIERGAMPTTTRETVEMEMINGTHRNHPLQSADLGRCMVANKMPISGTVHLCKREKRCLSGSLSVVLSTQWPACLLPGVMHFHYFVCDTGAEAGAGGARLIFGGKSQMPKDTSVRQPPTRHLGKGYLLCLDLPQDTTLPLEVGT